MSKTIIDRAALLKARKEALDAGVDDSPEHRVGSAVTSPRRYDPESGVTSLLSDKSTGDWSWHPERYPQDPGHVFTDAEILALYPKREYIPNARVSCG